MKWINNRYIQNNADAIKSYTRFSDSPTLFTEKCHYKLKSILAISPSPERKNLINTMKNNFQETISSRSFAIP